MSEKLAFEVGIRLLGIYFLFRGLPLFLITVAELLLPVEAKSGILEKENWYRLTSSVGYLIFIIMGVWLMKGPSFFYRMAFQEEESAESAREFFAIGSKLFGVLLVIGTIPSLLEALTYFLLIAKSGFAGAVLESRAYFVPQLGSMLFGVLLFFRGELLANWAFADRNPVAGADENG